MYVVHALPPLENTGTPLAAFGYATRLAQRGWDVTVVSAEVGQTGWPTELERRPSESFARVTVPPTPHLGSYWAIEAPTASRRPEAIEANTFRRLLQTASPDVVHVVDNVHLPLDWPEIAAARGIPVVRTVSCAEDLCALVAPVSPCSGPKGFCSAPITPERCARCVRAQLPGEYPPPFDNNGSSSEESLFSSDAGGDQLLAKLRRKRARAIAQYRSVFDRVVFSGPGWREYFEATLRLDPSRVRVVEMGMDLTPWRNRPARVRKEPGQPVVIALAGALHPARGQLDAVRAFARPELAQRDDYRLRFLGGGDDEEQKHEGAALAGCGNPDIEAGERRSPTHDDEG